MSKLALLAIALTASLAAPGRASAQPAPGAADTELASSGPPSGHIVVRAGAYDGDMDSPAGDWLMDTGELAIAVQPMASRDGWERGLIVGARAGLGGQGDFNGFARAGFEAGYVYRAPPLWRHVQFGVAATVLADRWDVWRETPQEGELHGNHWVLGGALRPFVRVWRFELSVPLERGGGFEPGTAFSSRGLQFGLVIF